MDTRLAIIILAAGKSRRFNGIKQLAPYKGTTLLNHVISQCVNAEIGDVFIILGAYFKEIEKSISMTKDRIIYNKDWYKGMGNSLAYGIEKLEYMFDYEGVLIVLGDQPMVTAKYIKSLCAHYLKTEMSIIATLYDNDNLGPPVFISKKYFNQLKELDGDKGAKFIIKNYTDDLKLVKNAELVSNDIDTNEDYDRLLKIENLKKS